MFRSSCGLEFELEADRDNHEGQCTDCIDILHGLFVDEEHEEDLSLEEEEAERELGEDESH
jgi:hypothetical protein